MSKTISTVHLFSVRVARNGDVHMSASRNFFEVLRSKLGASPGSTLRVGSFDFMEVRKHQFVGIADERNSDSLKEAVQLANRVLMIYRSILLFERVFEVEGSFNNFVIFNGRSPVFSDLQLLAKKSGIVIPFMGLPYKANLLDQPVAIATVIESQLEKRSVTTFSVSNQKNARTLSFVKKPVSINRLSALKEHFKHV